MALDYGWEKLHGAVIFLCGLRDIRSRLTTAISSNSVRIETERDLPKNLRKVSTQFMNKVSND